MVKSPLLDYGTPEEEAWRWKVVPLYIRYQRLHDTYLYTAKYYDKPEGQDLLGKLIASNRQLLPIGVIWGTVDCFMHSKATGLQQRLGRVIHFAWPAAAVATTFTTTTYFATRLRQKDDGWNYGLGAIAAGSVVGAWQRCHIIGWSAALLFCIVAHAQRISIDEGWKWWTYKEQEPGDHRWHKNQWHLYKDPLPKGYTTSTDDL